MIKYHVFLGGQDGEMVEIKKIAELDDRCVVCDADLSWGAKVSAYEEGLNQLNKRNLAIQLDRMFPPDGGELFIYPVLVELDVDMDLSKYEGMTYNWKPIVIDHHGKRAGEPPAIIQFLNLLDIEPTREQCLIGAMDAGWVYGLEAIGATNQEIAKFINVDQWLSVGEMLTIAADRGITEEERFQAIKAVDSTKLLGDMFIVHCAHSKCAPITARLKDRQKEQNILVISEDGEVNYFGSPEIVKQLSAQFPGSWSGGAGLYPPTKESLEFWTKFGGKCPTSAFWGCTGAKEKIEKIIEGILDSKTK